MAEGDVLLSGFRRLTFYEKVLAVDLLNPTPAAEARKHKLKVRSDSRGSREC